MPPKIPDAWKEIALIVVICGISLAALVYDGTPIWLRALIIFLATVGPVLPMLALIPWHFIAKHRGLTSRNAIPTIVSCSNGAVHIECGDKQRSHSFEHIVRARLARNDNWTESKMLEDALGLFSPNGREIERIPESAKGFAGLLAELNARAIPIEEVDVSAPAVLD